MKDLGSHDFSYYEEKSAYFQYTHSSDRYELTENEEEYVELPEKVFEVIQKRAKRDVKHDRPQITRQDLEELLLDAGLLKYGKTAPVMDELIWDYQYVYEMAKQKGQDD